MTHSVGRVRSHLQNGRRNLKICLEGQQNEP
jgi:DNA-directed RNA polymerase specialized sigma24 family protein